MKYISVCSGIEAATVAWHDLGWSPAWFSEIEQFPSAVLAHHYPDVPNRGDMTKYEEWPDEAVDLLVGGTPCASFSVAGLRKGLSDPRGGLMLTYLEIARRYRPRWVVWENVPGVLSSNGGRDLASLLGGLSQLGYGWAYRVLDAQYCRVDGRWPKALPQRRRRVFVVGCLGDWTAAGKVLFERESVQRDSAPRRAQRQAAPADAEAGVGAGIHDTVGALCADTHPGAYSGQDAYTGRLVPQPVASTLGNRGLRSHTELDGHGAYIPQPVAIQGNLINRDAGGPHGVGASDEGASYTLTKADVHGVAHPVAFQQNTRDEVRLIGGDGQIAGCLAAEPGMKQQNYVAQPMAFVQPVADPITAHEGRTYTHEGSNNFRTRNVQATAMRVRRLTPRECERLMGFPDDYTAIPWRGKPADQCPDGPRYKALGNGMAVNCMAWIGQRIQAQEGQ